VEILRCDRRLSVNFEIVWVLHIFGDEQVIYLLFLLFLSNDLFTGFHNA
jgi:hypothetical protein